MAMTDGTSPRLDGRIVRKNRERKDRIPPTAPETPPNRRIGAAHMTDNDNKTPDRIAVGDPRSHETPQEQAAWVRFAAAGIAAQGINTVRPEPNALDVAITIADDLVVAMRKRDRTFDGER